MEIAESRSIDEIVTNGYRVRVWDYAKKGWKVFRKWPLGLFLFTVLCNISQNLCMWISPVLGSVTFWIFGAWVPIGIALAAWKILQGLPISVTSFFPDLKTMFWGLLCFLITFTIWPLSVYLFVIVPISWEWPLRVVFISFAVAFWAFYLLLTLTSFPLFLIADGRTNVLEAFRTSFLVMSQNTLGILKVVVVAITISLLTIGFFQLPVTWLIEYLPADLLPKITVFQPKPFWVTFGWSSFAGSYWKTVDLGVYLGTVTGQSLGVSLSLCISAVAYADIFGLRRDRTKDDPVLNPATT